VPFYHKKIENPSILMYPKLRLIFGHYNKTAYELSQQGAKHRRVPAVAGNPYH